MLMLLRKGAMALNKIVIFLGSITIHHIYLDIFKCRQKHLNARIERQSHISLFFFVKYLNIDTDKLLFHIYTK